MSAHTLEDAKQAWGRAYEGLSREDVNRRVRALAVLVRGIADSGVVSPEEFASALGVDEAKARQIFSELAAVGMQLDADGNIAGAALTATKTPHVIKVRGRELYAWCALDALFLPGLLGVTAEVESSCPVSREKIHLSVSATGVSSYSPPGAVLSVVLPGEASGLATGPASPT